VTREFTLDLAGLIVRVAAPAADWSEPLIDRYVAFHSNEPPRWHVELIADPQLAGAEMPWIRHLGPVTRFRLLSLEGAIDLAGRRAHVCAPGPTWAASALERVLTYILMQAMPRERDGLLIHGAGIVLDAAGHVFAGPSGAGKSTVAGLAHSIGEVLSDENVVVRLDSDGAVLHSTPFWGQSTPAERIYRVNRRVPLAAIHLLAHAPGFERTPLRPAEAVAAILSTEKVATERVESASAWLAVAERLVARVPVYRLAFRPTAEIWQHIR
jgi:hypothetical protein